MTYCPWLFLHQMGTWSIIRSSSAEVKKTSRVLHTSLALMKLPFPSARRQLTMKGVNLKRFRFFLNWYLEGMSRGHRVGFPGHVGLVSPRPCPHLSDDTTRSLAAAHLGEEKALKGWVLPGHMGLERAPFGFPKFTSNNPGDKVAHKRHCSSTV